MDASEDDIPAKMTKKQRKLVVYELKRKKYTVKEISDRLHVSIGTVKRDLITIGNEGITWFERIAKTDFVPEVYDTFLAIDENISDTWKHIETLEHDHKEFYALFKQWFDLVPPEKPGTAFIALQAFSNEIKTFHSTRLDMKKFIDSNLYKRGELLHKLPMIHNIKYVMEKKTNDPTPTQQLPALSEQEHVLTKRD